MTEVKKYLGDSVYIRWAGYDFVLYLDNGTGEKSNIVLEPEVMRALIEFVRDPHK